MKLDMNRVALVMDYLQAGGRFKHEGITWAWLDNYRAEYGYIDGLAVATRKYNMGEDYNDPNAGVEYFIGAPDMSVNAFFKLINEIPSEEMVKIIKDLKRIKKGN